MTSVRYEGQRRPDCAWVPPYTVPTPANALEQIDVLVPTDLSYPPGNSFPVTAQYHFRVGQPASVPDSHATWLLGHPLYAFSQTTTAAPPDARMVRVG